jgi:uncharacterized membrane protein
MKNLITKWEWVLVTIALLPCLLLYVYWNQIPQTIPTHYNFEGNADAWGDKSMLLWMIPGLSLFLYLLLLVIPLIDPKKLLETMGNKYFTIRLIVQGLISSICVIIVLAALNTQLNFTSVIIPVMAFFFTLLGYFLPSVKSNYFVGIRTPWTLNDEQNWAQTHRLGGWVFMIGGAVMLLAYLVLNELTFAIVLMVCIGAMVLIPIGYSFYLFVKKKKTEE